MGQDQPVAARGGSLMGTRLLDRPGVVSVVLSGGHWCAVAECARCGQVKLIKARGLCQRCHRACTAARVLGGYGYGKAEKMADYVMARLRDLTITDAAAAVGLSARQGQRYELEIRHGLLLVVSVLRGGVPAGIGMSFRGARSIRGTGPLPAGRNH